MGEIIQLFQGAVEVDEEDWPSGLPMTFEAIGNFMYNVQALLELENDPAGFAAQMGRIRELVQDWRPDG